MAAGVLKQEFLIKDLPTRAVTLYPTRAHIIRDIPDITLQPGPNEIEIYGLTPTTDEHSVQIDGKGAATITDMTVELVHNRETFDHFYSDDSASDTTDDEDYNDEDEDSDSDPAAVKSLSQTIKSLQCQIDELQEKKNAANHQATVLDGFSKSANAEHIAPEEMAKLLAMYESERLRLFRSHSDAERQIKELVKQKNRREKEKQKVGKEERKRKRQVRKEKQKQIRKKQMQERLKFDEKTQARLEKQKFWPKKVYKVILRVEGPTDTPTSSRRSSIGSITLSGHIPPDTKAVDPEPPTTAERKQISLSLSYIAREASWFPRYDMEIDSVKRTASIIYRAEFMNYTSETWKDAKLTLSTSQTSFSGLEDKVPFMNAWHVRLEKGSESGDSGLVSGQEARKSQFGPKKFASRINRYDLFEVGNIKEQGSIARRGGLFGNAPPACKTYNKGISEPTEPVLFGSSALFSHGAPLPPTGQSALYQAVPRYQQAQAQVLPQQQVQQAVTRATVETEHVGGPPWGPSVTDGGYEFSDVLEPEIAFEESTWEDTGLTATYDVPGLRTLEPSSQTRRYRITTLSARNIHLSYITVPKLRAAAFFRAKIRNPSSSVTLLRGQAGITLDASFLGLMTLPRTSPGQVLDVPLGVDPAVHISYPKPTVKRSTQGIFGKESAQAFSRSIWITNTRPTSVEMVVLDQIPISDDERLRIDLMQPKGLDREGDSVKTGMSAREGSSGTMKITQSGAWGRAVATLKKEGEMAWNVTIEKGQACLLKLDYEAKMPTSDKIVSV